MTWSKDDFDMQVAELYRNLYDLVYLRSHPVTDLLVPDPSVLRKNRGWQVHHLLLDAIEELNPGPGAPASSREWRRHQILVLRYVDGLEPRAVARELNISERQYFREHKVALGAVADILWDRCHGASSPPADAPQSVEERPALKRLELLRLEAARAGQGSRYARIDDVVRGVLPLLQEMMQARRLTMHLSIPPELPAALVDKSLLRQIVLGTLGYLVSCAEEATIWVAAQAQGAEIDLAARVEPVGAMDPASQAEAEERLAPLEEMAALASARLDQVRDGDLVTGILIGLPVAQRTVLVVDDNEDTLELLRRYLTSLHYRVITVRTAAEALEQARQLQPDIITLDLMMPDQDGWDLLQTLLHQPETHHIPIIVCTVLRQKALALSLGATAFLEKPVSEQTLLSVLQSLEKT